MIESSTYAKGNLNTMMKILFWSLILCGIGLCRAEPVMEVAVTLRIEGQGPRPYVALWVEDADGGYIRTLRVWGTQPKYQRKLRHWNRVANAADGISGATRPNGDYQASWDGSGQNGRPVSPGSYVIRAESIREDGPHCRTECRISLTGAASRAEGESDGDIRALHVTVQPRSAEHP
jgi:hypothetical protein